MKEIKVFKFWAPWCGPCKALSSALEGLDMEHFNIDEEEGSKKAVEYKIRNIPAIVFLENGVEVDRSVGLISKKEYLEKLEKLSN